MRPCTSGTLCRDFILDETYDHMFRSSVYRTAAADWTRFCVNICCLGFWGIRDFRDLEVRGCIEGLLGTEHSVWDGAVKLFYRGLGCVCSPGYYGTFTRTFLTMFEILFANWSPPARVLVENFSNSPKGRRTVTRKAILNLQCCIVLSPALT